MPKEGDTKRILSKQEANRPWRIRAAGPEDITGIASVHVDAWRTTYRGIMPEETLADLSYQRREERWSRVLVEKDPKEIVYVVEGVKAEVVGFASGGAERSGDLEYKGELYTIYLLAYVHRRGLGKMLTLSIVRALQDRGIDSMLAWVLTQNPACRFYEGLGGIAARTRQETFGGGNLRRDRLRLEGFRA